MGPLAMVEFAFHRSGFDTQNANVVNLVRVISIIHTSLRYALSVASITLYYIRYANNVCDGIGTVLMLSC